MSLHESLKKEIATAMKARDAERLLVLRSVVTALTNELVAKRRKPDEVLSDEDTVAVIKREYRKRKDASEQFTAGGRPELAEKEDAECVILETYLPKMLDDAAISAVVIEKKAALGITDPKDKGKLIGTVMKELAGKADGGDVSRIVDASFAS